MWSWNQSLQGRHAVIELFQEWAKNGPAKTPPVPPRPNDLGGTKKSNNIKDVTSATNATKEKQQSAKNNRLLNQSIFSKGNAKSAVAPVAPVAPLKSLEKTCHPSLDTSGGTGGTLHTCKLLSDADLCEGASWPPETQRVWAAAVKHFEGKACSIGQAETLAFAMVHKLIKRRKTRHLILVSDLPPEVGRAVAMGLEVFSDAQMEWIPEPN
jgi:hypothetical protein